mgnify:CR=1 FL=1|tara:strand:- start:293 stop:541 length:249 start_codon:yes stop_codon:yes gene_type:complete
MTIIEIYNSASLSPTEIKQMSVWLSPNCEDDSYEFYDSSAYEKLFEYFAFQTCEMPYGTAKARDGEPDIWILERLEALYENK